MIKILNIIVLIVIINLLLSFEIKAQSFDCDKATTIVEKAICDHYFILGIADSEMATTYEHAIVTPGIDKNYLLKNQREIIKKREACAKSSELVQCVLDITSSRRVELEDMIESFSPKPEGRTNVRVLTGSYKYNVATKVGIILIVEKPGDILTFYYESFHPVHKCSIDDLTIPRSVAEQNALKGLPVRFYNKENDLEVELSYYQNGIQFNNLSRRYKTEDLYNLELCNNKWTIFTNKFYEKFK
ncbi:MAG: hypothetical protein LBE80_02545 [Deltaproteobacteria bacterium]|jgi:uncharacterized protein YecT (DUF1311 family)|nr:hypothetical protein [Deltaproteobacteria bacterium]